MLIFFAHGWDKSTMCDAHLVCIWFKQTNHVRCNFRFTKKKCRCRSSPAAPLVAIAHPLAGSKGESSIGRKLACPAHRQRGPAVSHLVEKMSGVVVETMKKLMSHTPSCGAARSCCWSGRPDLVADPADLPPPVGEHRIHGEDGAEATDLLKVVKEDVVRCMLASFMPDFSKRATTSRFSQISKMHGRLVVYKRQRGGTRTNLTDGRARMVGNMT